jgi:two-component system chemotaxis sensor kinase CheA
MAKRDKQDSVPGDSVAQRPVTAADALAFSYSIDPDDEELIAEFLAESQEHFSAAEEAVIALEAHPRDADALGVAFRAFHTIKGVAAALALGGIPEFAHKVESLLAEVRDGGRKFTPSMATQTLASIDVLRTLLAQLEAREALVAPKGFSALLTALEQLQSGEPEASGELAGACLSDPNLSTSDVRPQDEPAAVEATATAGGGRQRADESWVRVRTERFDRVTDMIGELVVAQAIVDQFAKTQGDSDPLLRNRVEQVSKIARELQELSLALRMVPVRGLFQKLARTFRDTCTRTGKQADLVTEGDDTEIDRSLVERITDPLVHMVRNSLGHGIESADARIQLGKAPRGRLTISAEHSGGQIVIRVRDDGAGIDPARLIAKAVERGLIDRTELLTAEQARALIFEPGFSTSETVNDVSGRGVGMDVVRQSVQALGGHVELSTEVGVGTEFSLRLPLTLAITEGMLIQTDGHRYVVPTHSILISLPESKCEVRSAAARYEFIVVRGQSIPLLRLGELLGIRARPSPVVEQRLVIVIESGREHLALLVDELLGTQQVVTKPLGDFVGALRGVSGATILSDGRVGLVLDPAGLLGAARRRLNRATSGQRGETCRPVSPVAN